MISPDREDRRLLLHAALDGELDAAGAIEMERALATDPELAADDERLTALRQTVRVHAPREEAPASLRLRVLEALESQQTPLAKTTPKIWSHTPSWRSFAGAIAATMVLTVGLQRLVETNNAPNATMQAIVSAHMRSQISGQPVDVVSSDRHAVKPWIAGKLPVAAVVVDLASEGFPLLGGRIDIVAGTAAPTLVYKRREHLVSVTELRAYGSEYQATPKHRILEGYPVIVWSDGERGYAVVSDLAPAELDTFVKAFRKAAASERKDTGALEPPAK
jgi:anti-sigma factor RsiW